MIRTGDSLYMITSECYTLHQVSCFLTNLNDPEHIQANGKKDYPVLHLIPTLPKLLRLSSSFAKSRSSDVISRLLRSKASTTLRPELLAAYDPKEWVGCLLDESDPACCINPSDDLLSCAMAAAAAVHSVLPHHLLSSNAPSERTRTSNPPPRNEEQKQAQRQFVAQYQEDGRTISPAAIAQDPRNKELGGSSPQLRVTDFELLKTLGTGTNKLLTEGL